MASQPTIQRDADMFTITASGASIEVARDDIHVRVSGRPAAGAKETAFTVARSDYDMFGARVASTWKQELYEADTHASLGNPMNAQLRIDRTAPRVLTATLNGPAGGFTIEQLDGFELISAVATLMGHQPPAAQLSA